MIKLLFIWVGFRIRFADTFCDYLGVAFFVTRIFAILALHTSRVFEKFSAESTTHDVVKLLKDKFMAVKLMNFFFALTDSAFTVETNVEGSSVFELFCCHTLVFLHEERMRDGWAHRSSKSTESYPPARGQTMHRRHQDLKEAGLRCMKPVPMSLSNPVDHGLVIGVMMSTQSLVCFACLDCPSCLLLPNHRPDPLQSFFVSSLLRYQIS